jgi:hypothetical protein
MDHLERLLYILTNHSMDAVHNHVLPTIIPKFPKAPTLVHVGMALLKPNIQGIYTDPQLTFDYFAAPKTWSRIIPTETVAAHLHRTRSWYFRCLGTGMGIVPLTPDELAHAVRTRMGRLPAHRRLSHYTLLDGEATFFNKHFAETGCHG